MHWVLGIYSKLKRLEALSDMESVSQGRKIMKNKTTLSVIIYVIVFSVGFFGGFSYLENVLDPYLYTFRINAKQIVYVFVFIYSIIALYPFLNDGLNNLKKVDLNEIISVLFIVALLGFIIMVSFDLDSSKSENTNSQIAISIIFSPIIEELYCRCALIFLINKYLNIENIVCILISGSVFSLYHYKNFMGADLNYIICYLLIYFILGIGCSYLYLQSDNIFSPIILHIIWNVCAIGGSLFL